MRLKTKWSNSSGKTLKQMGSALAFSSFRLTKNQLEDLINEKFQVERDELFGIISAYLVFLVNIIDRLSFNKLKDNQRLELITAVVKQLAHYYAENKNDVFKTNEFSADEFIKIYNENSKAYINCIKIDYSFYKVFAGFISRVAKEEDKYWINQQINEIQAPNSYDEILKAFDNIVIPSQIITDEEKSKQEKNKTSRAKRQKTFKEYQK